MPEQKAQIRVPEQEAAEQVVPEVAHEIALDQRNLEAFNKHEVVAKDIEPSGNFIGLKNSNFQKIVNPPGHKPTILIWAGQFGSHVQYLANPEVCGGDVDCDITYDRSKLGESGALVFHFTGASSAKSVPGPRFVHIFLLNLHYARKEKTMCETKSQTAAS